MTKASRRKAARAQRRPTLALSIIARDEEQFIGRCIASAKDWVDEIVVVDTGSVDRTREIAQEYGARVSEFVWCDDFAAARNAAIDAATADWILALDADEELDPASGPVVRSLIESIPPEIHCLAPRIESVVRTDAPDGYLVSHHNRLFRRQPDLRWVGAIHEQIKFLPAPEATVCVLAPAIRITHAGYIPEYYQARGKDDRNVRILHRTLEEKPNDPAVYFHIGLQHSAMERHAEAVVALRKCIDLVGDQRPWFLIDAYVRLINSLLATSQHDGLEHVVEAADAENLLSKKARELVANHVAALGRNAEAERHLLTALSPDCPPGLTEFPGAGSWATRVALGRLYERMQRPQAALEQLELALAAPDLPRRQRVCVDASRVAHELRDVTRAMDYLGQAMLQDVDDIEGQLALLKLSVVLLADPAIDRGIANLPAIDALMAHEDWQLAYDMALTMSPDGAQSLARMLYLSERLLDLEAADAALDVLGRALDAHPASAHVYWLLIRVLAKLDRYDDALAAIEILRRMPEGERHTLALSLEVEKSQMAKIAA